VRACRRLQQRVAARSVPGVSCGAVEHPCCCGVRRAAASLTTPPPTPLTRPPSRTPQHRAVLGRRAGGVHVQPADAQRGHAAVCGHGCVLPPLSQSAAVAARDWGPCCCCASARVRHHAASHHVPSRQPRLSCLPLATPRRLPHRRQPLPVGLPRLGCVRGVAPAGRGTRFVSSAGGSLQWHPHALMLPPPAPPPLCLQPTTAASTSTTSPGRTCSVASARACCCRSCRRRAARSRPPTASWWR
jgi:hypothetical protein